MLTVACHSCSELEVKRSRFIAYAGRVDSTAETLAFYQAVADPGASHNCWAWRLEQRYRFHDDGEPAGTGGKPILAALDSRNLDHTMVVVTRYFGGTKLGVGGLIRAYGTSAARCLEGAGSASIAPAVKCSITAAFRWTGDVYAALETFGARKLKEAHGTGGFYVEAELVEKDFADFARRLRDSTRGEVTVRRKSRPAVAHRPEATSGDQA